MKTRTKLIAGFAGVVILVVGASHFTGNLAVNFRKQFYVLEDEIFPSILRMNEIEREAGDVFSDTMEYAVTGSAGAKEATLSGTDHLTELGIAHFNQEAQVGGEEEEDARELGAKGMAAWGLSLPFWMRAKWFKRNSYRRVDKVGPAVLMWKPFTEDALPPKWIRERKWPGKVDGKVSVVSFINGYCMAQNLVYERAKRASAEFPDKVDFQEVDTSHREIYLEWGIADGSSSMARRSGPAHHPLMRRYGSSSPSG